MSGWARGLDVYLSGVHVGYLISHSSGANAFHFSESYIALGQSRPVLGQAFVDVGGVEAGTVARLRQQYVSRQKVPPFFSNLLPEGMLREYVAKSLKTHPDNEFEMLAHLGANLPGAVVLKPSKRIPDALLREDVRAVYGTSVSEVLPFSLGGAQLKFSMFRHGERFAYGDGRAEYIVKPPHPTLDRVPENEFLAMRLAQAAGLDVPETILVPLDALEEKDSHRFGFRRDEPYAYAIRRFDRAVGGERIHVEDFAQVLDIYPAKQYTATNYDTVLKVLSHLPDGEASVAEMVRRLVINALLANGDAHLKNIGLIYPGGRTPRLGPLYDVVITAPYIGQKEAAALNLGGTKRFQDYDAALFSRVARRADLSEEGILRAVKETVDRAATLWPGVLREVKPPPFLKKALQAHWGTLSHDLSGGLVRSFARPSKSMGLGI